MRNERRRLIAAIVPLLGLVFLVITMPHETMKYAQGLARVTGGVLTQWFPPRPPPQVPGMSELERGAWRTLGRLVNGRLLWSSNRNGNHDLYLVELGSGAERRLTDHPHVDFFSRFSPDGTQVSFLRSQRPWVSFRDETAWDLYMMNAERLRPAAVGRGCVSPNLASGRDWSRVRLRESRSLITISLPQTAAVIHRGSDPPTSGPGAGAGAVGRRPAGDHSP